MQAKWRSEGRGRRAQSEKSRRCNQRQHESRHDGDSPTERAQLWKWKVRHTGALVKSGDGLQELFGRLEAERRIPG